MKIKVEIRTNKMAGEVALDEIRKAMKEIGFEENKEYSIQAYQVRPEGK